MIVNTTNNLSAYGAPTQYVDANGWRLAFRSIGEGTPIVLCTRFRGNMDLWDPLFLDSIVAKGFRVITFDYGGLGLSSGPRDYNPFSLARDAHDLAEALQLERFAIAGWSLGGLAAQAFLAMHSDMVSHVVLIATGPPGSSVKPPEQLSYDIASKPENSLDDEIILFFEPRSAASRAAAARSRERIASRTVDRSAPVPIDFAVSFLGKTPRNPIFPAEPVRAALKRRPFRFCT